MIAERAPNELYGTPFDLAESKTRETREIFWFPMDQFLSHSGPPYKSHR